MTKKFLVKYDIRDGEAEYDQAVVVEADNMDEAFGLAQKTLEDDKPTSDYREYIVRSSQPITDTLAWTFSKYGLAYSL